MINKRYTRDYKVQSVFVGADKHIRPATLAMLMQEMGAEHSQLFGVSGPQLATKRVAWIVTRTQISVQRYPKLEEDVELTTWIREPKGFFVPRDVEGRDKDGNILFQGCTFWIPFHIDKKRPERAINYIGGIDVATPEEELPFTPQKLKPLTAHEHALKIPVMVRDIDTNAHVTNGVYIDWLVEAMVQQFGWNIQLKSIAINYLQEIPQGVKEVEVRTQQVDDTTFYHSLVQPETGVEHCRAETVWEGLS